jgi:hypothetical protein
MSTESGPAGSGLAASGLAQADPGPAGSPPRRLGRKSLLIRAAAVVAAAAVIAAVMLVTTGKPAAAKLAYTRLPAPCSLLSSATVARYLPGASSSPANASPARLSQVGACTWSSVSGGEDRTLLLQAEVYGSASGLTAAEQAYTREDPAGNCQCHGYKVTRQTVSGLGDQAVALFTTTAAVRTGSWSVPTVSLLVRSGNADISLGYDLAGIGPAGTPPTRAALLAATVAMARNMLASLSRPTA